MTATIALPGSDCDSLMVEARLGPSRLRRLVTAFVLSVLALAGAVTASVATAPTASAATFSSTARVCFQQTGGGAFTGPTQMWAYVEGGWGLVLTQPGTNSGCRTWSTPDNIYLQFRVNYTLSASTWTSASAVYYNPPRQASDFGTYLVTWRVRK